MSKCSVAAVLISVCVLPVNAQVIVYEAADTFPEEQGWDRSTFCFPERWLSEGTFFQHVDPIVPECGPGPPGDRETFVRSTDPFFGINALFMEWRMQTDGGSFRDHRCRTSGDRRGR